MSNPKHASKTPSAHTPGPWRVGVINLNGVIRYHVEAGSTSQYTCEFPANNPTEADARLIAAAPELLEACKAALQLAYPERTYALNVRWFDEVLTPILRAAITKAEGGTK